MRTETVFLPKSISFSALTMLRRARSLSSGATASSRSRNSTSTADFAAFSKSSGRLPGTDLQFVIRRADPKGATRLRARERYADRRPLDRAADAAFLAALWEHFGSEPFLRGNLDAGRLGWLFAREVVAAEDPFDPASYDARLRVDEVRARQSFPEVFDDG